MRWSSSNRKRSFVGIAMDLEPGGARNRATAWAASCRQGAARAWIRRMHGENGATLASHKLSCLRASVCRQRFGHASNAYVHRRAFEKGCLDASIGDAYRNGSTFPANAKRRVLPVRRKLRIDGKRAASHIEARKTEDHRPQSESKSAIRTPPALFGSRSRSRDAVSRR